MAKVVDQKLAAGRNPGKPVSQSLARKLLGRSAVGAIAAVVFLPLASVGLLATTTVPTYAQAAGSCRTADDDATIKAMQDLIASLDAELATLQTQLTAAEADAKDIQAQINALDQKFANSEQVPDGDLMMRDLTGKLGDALGKVNQINGQISNDQGHKARAEGVIKALLAKKPCPPPAITDNRTPDVPGSQWQLVEWIHFNDNGTEIWHWKDGHETVRTRTGIALVPPVESHLVPNSRTIEPPKPRLDLPHSTVTPVPRTDTGKVTPPVTDTTPSVTTRRTFATTATTARVGLHPIPLADHATTATGHSVVAPSTIRPSLTTSMMHSSFAKMPSIGAVHTAMSPVATPRVGGFGKIR
jgi:hypothetical protein